MNVRSFLGSLQLPVAGLGAIVCLGAIASIATLPPSPADEGFVRGLAVVALFVLAWVGFVLIAVGLAVPPGNGLGIRFTPWQRRLFGIAAGLALLSAVSPLAFWAVVAATGLSLGSAALAWVVVMGLAVAARLAGLGWRVGEAAVSRLATG